ncbi:MAG TPA: 3'-5' exonuclease [Steroidobacteraceae bacterium]|nr:3'-5' exonuclease [Steroidobacteraceae bacterium]
MTTPLHCLVFDIETVPDVELGRRLPGIGDGDDAAVAEAMFARRNEETGSPFLPYEQHRVVAISALLRSADQFRLWSIGTADSPEDELLRRFFSGIDKLKPTLVTWNGSGFDLPVLHYRMLRHGVAAPVYWDTGELDRDFKWNNYLNRFHMRHIDLMDVLSGYQARGRASLEHVALLLGLPGKLGMAGDQVWGAWQEGRIGEIRDYCETDVMNTYLVYLRFELVRGRLSAKACAQEIERARDWLGERREDHWRRFLAAWRQD